MKKIGMGKNNDVLAINLNVEHLKQMSRNKQKE